MRNIRALSEQNQNGHRQPHQYENHKDPKQRMSHANVFPENAAFRASRRTETLWAYFFRRSALDTSLYQRGVPRFEVNSQVGEKARNHRHENSDDDVEQRIRMHVIGERADEEHHGETLVPPTHVSGYFNAVDQEPHSEAKKEGSTSGVDGVVRVIVTDEYVSENQNRMIQRRNGAGWNNDRARNSWMPRSH